MSGDFFDTNVLLYVVSNDAAKADRAEALMRQGGAISVQVLNEATNVMRRKLRRDRPKIQELLAVLRGLLNVVPVTVETHGRLS